MRFKLLSLLLVGTLTIGNLHIIAYASEPSYDVFLDASQGTSVDDVIDEVTEDTSQDDVIDEVTEDTSQDDVIDEVTEDTSQDDVIDEVTEDTSQDDAIDDSTEDSSGGLSEDDPNNSSDNSDEELLDDLPEDFYTVYPTGGTIDIDPPVQIESVSDGRRGLLMADYLPSYYVTPNLPLLKKQSPYGTCWAFAAVSLADINLMNSGIMPDADLSELHLAYFTYNTETDPLGGTAGDVTKMGASGILNFGGRAEWGLSTFARWIGAANEADAPYSLASIANKTGLDESLAYQDAAHIIGYYEEPIVRDNATISRNLHANLKKMIRKYGAIAIDFYAYDSMAASYSDKVYNVKTNAYYNDTDPGGTNHSVAIVGWNDDFPKTYFAKEAPGDGAFLVRNSWREGDGSENDYSYSGYFWMSYYESSLGKNAYAAEFALSDNYDNNYQYDGGLTYSAVKTNLVANVFNTHAEGGEDGELLEAVGFYTASSNVRYTIDIYKALSDTSNPESGTHITSATTTGMTSYAGQYTIPLAESVYLEPDTTFSVVLTMKKDDGVILGVEYSYSYGSVTIFPGQSFVYINKWTDLTRLSRYGNLCIKAYTNNAASEETPQEPEPEPVLPKTAGITYILNGGVNNAQNPDSYVIGETTDIYAPTNSKGYVFEGWYLDPQFSEESKRSAILPTDTTDIILYAKFGKTSLQEVEIEGLVSSFDYSGFEHRQENARLYMISGEEKIYLEEGEDYRISYVKDLTNAGKKAISFEGIGGFTDTLEAEYTVNAYDIQVDEQKDDPQITIVFLDKYGSEKEPDEAGLYCYTYEDNKTEPSVVVRFRSGNTEKTLVEKTDYVIEYANNSKVTEDEDFEKDTLPTVTIIGTGNFAGKISRHFCITRDHAIVPAMPPEFVITYHCNGGSNNPDNRTGYDSTDETFEILEPVQEDWPNGYRFAGWYRDTSYKTLVKEIKTGTSGNIDLYAKWLPYSYIVHFDGNGATSGQMADQAYTYGISKALNPNRYAKKGSVFLGWATSIQKADTGEAIYANRQVVSNLIAEQRQDKDEIRLFAVWKDSFDIRLDADGGVIGSDVLANNELTWESGVARGNYTYGKTRILPAPQKDGYTFGGWFTDTTYKKKVSSITAATWGDIELIARWIPLSFNISFNGNGANSGRMSVQKYTYGSYAALKKNTFTKRGYKFKGWSLEKADQVTLPDIADQEEIVCSYVDGQFVDKLNALGINKKNVTITLYALWEETDYRIKFETNGGELDSNEYLEVNRTEEGYLASYSYNHKGGYQLPEPVRNGYTFIGWYSDPNYRTRVKSIAQSSCADMILYARWNMTYYAVFDSGSGSMADNGITGVMKDQMIKYDTNTSLSGNRYKNPGYAFMGWALSREDADNGIVAFVNSQKLWRPEEALLTRDENGRFMLKLYAVWRNRFNIRYVLNGGSITAGDETFADEYTQEYTLMELPRKLPAADTCILEKDGYTFGGWYSDPKLRTRVTNLPKNSAGDKVFYAKWNSRKYTITYNADKPQDNRILTGRMARQTYSYGATKALARNTYKIKGYVFEGWSTHSYEERAAAVAEKLGMDNDEALWDLYDREYSSEDIEFAQGQKVDKIFEDYSADVTLYAVWRKEVYCITYRNVTNGEMTTLTSTYTVDDVVLFPEIQRIGYTFQGWFTNSNYSGRIMEVKTGSVGNKNLYGKWVLNK